MSIGCRTRPGRCCFPDTAQPEFACEIWQNFQRTEQRFPKTPKTLQLPATQFTTDSRPIEPIAQRTKIANRTTIPPIRRNRNRRLQGNRRELSTFCWCACRVGVQRIDFPTPISGAAARRFGNTGTVKTTDASADRFVHSGMNLPRFGDRWGSRRPSGVLTVSTVEINSTLPPVATTDLKVLAWFYVPEPN